MIHQISSLRPMMSLSLQCMYCIPKFTPMLSIESEGNFKCVYDKSVKSIDTGQINGEIERFIKEQIRQQLIITKGEA